MENKLQALQALKKIKLSESEKNALRSALARHVQEMPIEHRPMFESFIAHGLRIALSSFLFLILIGGSVSALANSSLPGDPLYSFKLNVNEEVKGRLVTKTPEQKVAFQEERIETRLKEIKLLADSQTLTKEKRAVVEDALSRHATKLSAELDALSTEKPEQALQVATRLQEKLRVQKDALVAAIPNGKSEERAAVMKTVDTALASVAEEQQQIIETELSKMETEIIRTESVDDMDEALIPILEEPVPTSEKNQDNKEKDTTFSTLPVTPREP